MKSISIHNLDTTLEYMIRKEAQNSNLSLNKTIQMLLKKAMGLTSNIKKTHEADFKDMSGVWSDKDMKEFKKGTTAFNHIDSEEWP
jgi:hypothetical protein